MPSFFNPPALSSFSNNFRAHLSPPRNLFLLVLLLLSALLSSLATPIQHSHLVSATAWSLLFLFTNLYARGGAGLGVKNGGRTPEHTRAHARARGLAWMAGGMFTMAKMQEAVVMIEDGHGKVRWGLALLPTLIIGMERMGSTRVMSRDGADGSMGLNKGDEDLSGVSNIWSTPLVLTAAAGSVALFPTSWIESVVPAGLAYAIFGALALVLVHRAAIEARNARNEDGRDALRTNHRLPTHSDDTRVSWTAVSVIRDVAFSAALQNGVAAVCLEGLRFGGLWYASALGPQIPAYMSTGRSIMIGLFALGTVVASTVKYGALLFMLQHQVLTTSVVLLHAAILSQLITGFSLSRLWFTTLCILSAFTLLDDVPSLSAGSRMKQRASRALLLAAIASFALLAVFSLQRTSFHISNFELRIPGAVPKSSSISLEQPLSPLRQATNRTHPVDQLVRDAEAAWLATLRGQSQTLGAAVAEYKRRYGIPPPPNFDRWYEFAKRRGVQIIDEYDTIYHSLLPFWALPPATIRARVAEALGFGPNNLMGLQIRNGQAVYVEGGQEWLQNAAVGMIEKFVQYLPDMDLAFNVHDEPRVVVPHDELSRLVGLGTGKLKEIATASASPKNSFSSQPKDLTNNKRITEVKTTRFNIFPHQPTWLPSRLSCSPDSPARALEDQAPDNLTAYAFGELGFIYNHTAFSDICNSPSFSTSHGFFDRPNAFNIVHDLFPIFSQSKMSSFQDILYPSPWYWYGKVAYQEEMDMDWKEKINSLWWRGSTTGGFSRDGGWRRQHRQQFVGKLNALDDVKIMHNVGALQGPDAAPDWKVKQVPRQDFKELIDVYFSHVGQCDPGDCDAQREYFYIAKPVDQQDAWRYRYLLDMDGNAFSGRFYAFLKSRSLTFKMAIFREWHEEWIKPWVHYVPLSLRGEETLEVVRYMSAEEEGKAQAMRMAETSRDWANKVLRNEDYEVWLFRLLLEYGRLVDDNRESIGYDGS